MKAYEFECGSTPSTQSLLCLRRERDRLRQQLAVVTAERDALLKALYHGTTIEDEDLRKTLKEWREAMGEV